MTQPTITATPQPTDALDEQYSLTKILTIWAIVAAPMGFITWIAVPFLEPRLDVEPGFVFLIMITLGLIWQGVVAYTILRKEVVPFTWPGYNKRFKSFWMSVIIHGLFNTIAIYIIVTLMILGKL